MSKKITVTWYADDGYTTGDRPMHTSIDPDDFEDCDTEDDVNEMISQQVQEDFEQKVCWCTDNLEKHVADIWARVQKARAERGED